MRFNDPQVDRDDGFTLLEVLISFVILSGVLGIIYQMLGRGAVASTTASNQEQAILIAKSKMSEAVLWPGENEGDEGKYKWSSIVTERSGSSERGTPRFLNINVVVRWNEFTGTREISFATQKLVPEVR